MVIASGWEPQVGAIDSAADFATAAGLVFVAISVAQQTREARRARAQREFDMYRSFEDRLEVLAPSLRSAFGVPTDGIPDDYREVAVRLLVLCAQFHEATASGLYEGSAGDGLDAELGYWLRRPEMVEAWKALGAQSAWPQGFSEFVGKLQAG